MAGFFADEEIPESASVALFLNRFSKLSDERERGVVYPLFCDYFEDIVTRACIFWIFWESSRHSTTESAANAHW